MLQYKVSGMSCGHCVKSVTSAVKKVAPMADINVDLTLGEVTVNGSEAKEKIAAAITDAGFEVRESAVRP